MAKGGSKVFTAIIAFILGFIFAIIVEVGAIFGIGYYALTADINSVFALFGMSNSDANGKQYINTDTNNGGVSNGLSLISKLQEMVGGIGAVTLKEMEELFPAMGSLTTTIYSSMSAYVTIDEEELENTQFMDLPEYLQNLVLEIQPATVMYNMGMADSLDSNVIVKAILAGTEASYVTDESGTTYPLYFDQYVYDEDMDSYYRVLPVDSETSFPANLKSAQSELLVKTNKTLDADDTKTIYRIYFYCVEDGTKQTEDGDTVTKYKYYAVKQVDGKYEYSRDYEYYTAYGDDAVAGRKDSEGEWEAKPALSGNYYYDNDGNKVVVKPVTLKTLTSDATEPLNEMPVTDMFEDQEIVAEIFGDTSLGDLINGKVDFQELINGVSLSSIMDISPTNTIMAYLGYKVSNVNAVEYDETVEAKPTYQYYGTVDLGDNVIVDCYIETKIKNDTEVIDRVYYYEGEDQVDVECCTVDGISDAVDGIAITALMEVKASDSIMAYLGFGIHQVQEAVGEELPYSHTAQLTVAAPEGSESETQDITVYIVTNKDGIITSVYYYQDEEKVAVGGTTVDELNDKVSNLTKELTIGEVIDIDPDDKFMVKLATYKIAEVGDAVNDFTIDDFMDINADDSIMMYISFSITKLEKVNDGKALNIDGEDYYIYKGMYNGNPIYIKTTKTVTDSSETYTVVAFYLDEDLTQETTDIESTKVKQVGDKVGTITDNLTLGELVDGIDESNKVLYAIKDSTVANIPTAINNLAVQEIYADVIYTDKSADDGTEIAREKFKVDKTTFDPDYLYFVYDAATEKYYYVNKYDETTGKYVYDAENGDSDMDTRGKITAWNDAWDSDDSVAYYTYGKASGTWKFMLYRVNKATEGGESSVVYTGERLYSVNELSSLMSNVTTNINSAKISDLVDAGIISESDGLSNKVPTSTTEIDDVTYYNMSALTDCTINEVIDSITWLTSADYAQGTIADAEHIAQNSCEGYGKCTHGYNFRIRG